MRCIALVLLAACGRLGFDERVAGTDAIDAPIDARPCMPTDIHDEDADGVVDSCDVCPHIAGAQADVDRDGVGDACDPEIDVPRQRIVLFESFASLSNWTLAGSVTAMGDSVQLAGAGNYGSLDRPFVPARDTFIVGAKAGVAGPSGQYLYAISFAEAVGSQVIYCEHYANGFGLVQLLVTYTLDGATYVHPGSMAAPALPNGGGRLSASIDGVNVACALTWNGTSVAAAGPGPAEIVPEVLSVYAENVELQLDYLIQIRTEP